MALHHRSQPPVRRKIVSYHILQQEEPSYPRKSTKNTPENQAAQLPHDCDQQGSKQCITRQLAVY
jgi:hypothetical protein